jgi:tRNA-splicing endonuclease subunit Sen34
MLRATHHICGVLTGTLPHASQQNLFLGLPLTLLPEEVVLLLNKGERLCT